MSAPQTPTPQTPISEFLARTPPFDELADGDLGDLTDAASLLYCRAGENVCGDDSEEIFIVRSGAVDCTTRTLDGVDVLIDRLGAAEVFPRQHVGDSHLYQAYEDTLLISIPRKAVAAVGQAYPGIPAFFSAPAARRRHDTRQLLTSLGSGGVADLSALQGTVAEAMILPVTVTPDTPIAQTAALMAEADLSSALVIEPFSESHAESGVLVGIVTDHDLRTRVVAQSRPTDTPTREIMTPDPPTTFPDTSLFEALIQLSASPIAHLPVVRRHGGAVAGVLTTAAMMRQLQADPIFTAAGLRDARPDQLQELYSTHHDVAVRFIDRGARPHEASKVLTLGLDELMARAVALAQEKLGPAPGPFCLVAMGSTGRGETHLSSDQDHALIVGQEDHSGYFERLGTEVTALVTQAGVPECPGEMMASNPRWRLTVPGWEHEFATWTHDLGHKDVMHAQTFVDMRAIAGDPSLCDQVLTKALRAARKDRRFVNTLIDIARRREPPLGFFRGFVLEKSGNYHNTVDLKKGGISAVVQLARLYYIVATRRAIEQGHGEHDAILSTRERLGYAAQMGIISHRQAEDLRDAFDVFELITLTHQAAQFHAGGDIDCRVNPEELGHLERESLRDAFRLVRMELRRAPGVGA